MALDDPLINRKLGDYTIVSLLGRGGMSRVYRGFDENLQRYAAVKVISGDFATTTEEEYTRRFTSEARAIARLRHPNIVGVYQFGRTEGIYYMAQVFLEGYDLRTLLKNYADQNRRIPFDEVLRIVHDVASALDYAHGQGVIHRDIKPSNIMLEKNTGRAILMDFGLAMSIHEGTMGDTFGSAHYIAPEQAISSAKAVPQSDQYSLGIVVYEMLAGKVPFDDPSVMSVALKHLNEVPPPPTMYNPDMPSAAEAVVLKALSKDPNRRHPNVTAFAQALEEAFGGAVVRDVALGWPGASIPDSRPTPVVKPAALAQVLAEAAEDEQHDGGIISRFSRRRAQREQDVALSRPADEGAVLLDDQSLDSLLQSMDRPMDRTDAQGQFRASDSLFGRPAADQSRANAAGVPRRSHRGRAWLKWLVALVVVSAVGTAAWFGLGLGQEGKDDDPGSSTGTIATQPDVPLPGTLSAGLPTVSAEPTTTQDVTLTREFTATPPATGRPTATLAVSATVETPASATSILTQTSAPTSTSAAETATQTAPATLTASPTGQSLSAATATAEPTSDTPSGTAVASGGDSVTEVRPDFRLVYDAESFLLVNISGRRQDVSALLFERTLVDGSVVSFDATQWDRPDIEIKPDAMIADGCYQLITTTATQATPDLTDCPLFLGYFRSNSPQSYFWLSTDDQAVFTVRQQGIAAPLATCSVAAGQCDVATPLETASVAATPETSPDITPTEQTSTPTIRLDYDDQHFILINITAQPQDVSRLHFVFDQPGLPARSFLSVEWDDAGIVGRTSSLRGGGCLELIASEGDVITPDPMACTSFQGWFRSNQDERYFWIADDPDAVFEVRVANDGTLLATCAIDARRCEFSIP